eukprot:650729-Prorocentrum_lima.AAC.1
MEVYAPTTGAGVGHVLSPAEASTLPPLPPASKEQWMVMHWIDSLPRGPSVNFTNTKMQNHFAWQ